MKIAVIVRQVPDVVEELVIADDGRSLSEDDVMYITNEADEHALEEALILKSRQGAKVTAVSVGGDEAKDALATAVAKGADEAVHVAVPFEHRGDNARLAAVLSPMMKPAGYDLILTGVWASDQIDAGLAGDLAMQLSLPYVGGVVSLSVDASGGPAVVRKEFPGGRLGVIEVSLPAVLGIQSAEQPPRYVPVSKVMATKRTLQVKQQGEPSTAVLGIRASKLVKSVSAAKAEMLAGDATQVAGEIVRILRERGIA
jgi:electron transfer flavoprotein beta subunit